MGSYRTDCPEEMRKTIRTPLLGLRHDEDPLSRDKSIDGELVKRWEGSR